MLNIKRIQWAALALSALLAGCAMTPQQLELQPVVEARRCMEVAAKHGVPVVVMEPARGGHLRLVPTLS